VAVAYFNVLGLLCGNEKNRIKEKGKINVEKGVLFTPTYALVFKLH